LQSGVAQAMNLSLDMAAFGISEVVDENMAAAARAHAAEFGLDLASRDMVAFGGAAPLHAARLGQKLGVGRIVIPSEAGVGSAVGFLLAPVAYEVVRSRHQRLGSLDADTVNGLMSEMRREAMEVVRQAAGQGIDINEVKETRHAYMRYVGQGHEIPVPLPVEEYDGNHGKIFQTAFDTAYRKLYGRLIDGIETEALSWTLTLSVKVAAAPVESGSPLNEWQLPAPVSMQPLFDPSIPGPIEAPVYMRKSLKPDSRLDGPALITEDQTTTVITSGYAARIDALGNIVLTRSTGE
jgi:N-methylhydantoinase A